MDRWIDGYIHTIQRVHIYVYTILNTRICVSFMLRTHARMHKSTRVHMNACIHTYNHTKTVV